jgi:hypothetical protein
VGEAVWVELYPDERLPDDGFAAPEARYELRESVELDGSENVLVRYEVRPGSA